MFRDLTESSSDGLLVVGRGLGLDRILLSFLSMHTDPRVLLLVVNLHEPDLSLLAEELQAFSAHHPPVCITTEQSAQERQALYLRGGVVFVTSRILVVDLLTGRVPMDRVTGLLVANAHLVTPTTSEAFILRLFRHANRSGFIKAVTDNPVAFVAGFNTVEKVCTSHEHTRARTHSLTHSRTHTRTLSLSRTRTCSLGVHRSFGACG
jgi:DNA excision repair protein ERCC-4